MASVTEHQQPIKLSRNEHDMDEYSRSGSLGLLAFGYMGLGFRGFAWIQGLGFRGSGFRVRDLNIQGKP